MKPLAEGRQMLQLIKDLLPLRRSLMGKGNRQTLKILQTHIPLNIKEVPSGTRAFDWRVPDEWTLRTAFVEDSQKRRIVDIENQLLHVVGYSTPIDKTVDLNELQEHLHSLPQLPEAIPYVTSYYKPYWGFCLTHKVRKKLKPGKYHVVIDSQLFKGSLTYGELYLPGKTKKEIFFSTYICHPSMANNELSGPVLATFLAKWVRSQHRYYSYRLIFVPETLGALVYLSKHIKQMKRNIIAGFILTCVGDDRTISYLPSRLGNTLSDRVICNVLSGREIKFKQYSFLDRGSDERQYCAPRVDLPIASLMRSKYGTYPEYHTSLDNLKFVSAKGLQTSFDLYRECLEALEHNRIYQTTCLGEPQLGKRKLYPTLSQAGKYDSLRPMMNLLAYADGKHDLIAISDLIGVPVNQLIPIVDTLLQHKLLRRLREQ